MANIKTRADSYREYLSGAASDGGVQPYESLSFGNYRSASEVQLRGILLTNMLLNLTIDYASGGCSLGDGTLTCVSDNHIAWTDPNGTQGPTVSLGVGASALIEDGTNANSFLRVSRRGSGTISGTPCTVTLSSLFNNQFGYDNVAIGDAAAGINEYRATILRNEANGGITELKRWLKLQGTQQVSNVACLVGASGGGTIQTSGSFATWPEYGYCNIKSGVGLLREIVYYSSRTSNTLNVIVGGRGLFSTTPHAGTLTDIVNAVPGVAIAIDSGGSQAFGSNIQTIANKITAPTSVTWNTGYNETLGLQIGTINANFQVGLWTWRQIPAGARYTPEQAIELSTKFNAT